MQTHRPNIISFIMEMPRQMSLNANMMYQYDEVYTLIIYNYLMQKNPLPQKAHSSYLLYQVDARVVLVGICLSRKSERDHMAVTLLSGK